MDAKTSLIFSAVFFISLNKLKKYWPSRKYSESSAFLRPNLHCVVFRVKSLPKDNKIREADFDLCEAITNPVPRDDNSVVILYISYIYIFKILKLCNSSSEANKN